MAGRPASGAEMPLRWPDGISSLGLLLIAVVLSGNRAEAVSESARLSREVASAVLSMAAGGTESIFGRYRVERDGDHFWLELRRDGSRGWRMSSLTLSTTDAVGPDDGKEGFEIRREAGTLFFDRDIHEGEASGHYYFQSDPGSSDEVSSLGFDRPGGEEQLFELALFDVSTSTRSSIDAARLDRQTVQIALQLAAAIVAIPRNACPS